MFFDLRAGIGREGPFAFDAIVHCAASFQGDTLAEMIENEALTRESAHERHCRRQLARVHQDVVRQTEPFEPFDSREKRWTIEKPVRLSLHDMPDARQPPPD